jgi:CAP12/Pycsar effector protein, TIR domain
MLNGRPTVFLSCSERFKANVAIPVRNALRAQGVFAVIVSEEPMLPRTRGDPDSKVESYLNASDAFVALCTPDDRLSDGTLQCRQNIIDEVQRALGKPHLRDRIQVFKESSVRLPSNINPTYERLDTDDVAAVVEMILRQLATWGVLAREPEPAPPPSTRPPASVEQLIEGIGLGEHDAAARRAYALLNSESRRTLEAIVDELRRFLLETSSEGGDKVHRASSVLEVIGRLDSSLVPISIAEELAESDDFTVRSTAAHLLWDRAEVAPGEIPLGLLGRLARPATEDWYVQAPAMAAAKLLLLRRASTRIIFEALAESSDAEERFAVADALLDVAKIDPTAAPRDLVERLVVDDDELVANKAAEALAAIGDEIPDRRDPRSPFGM